ncbi:hypothetical protein EI94DRAFT_1810210 [Lactarius quietus]|nr:hypothetical protein EI94DRAFT_1810210 [Lactarius quietus]
MLLLLQYNLLRLFLDSTLERVPALLRHTLDSCLPICVLLGETMSDRDSRVQREWFDALKRNQGFNIELIQEDLLHAIADELNNAIRDSENAVRDRENAARDREIELMRYILQMAQKIVC